MTLLSAQGVLLKKLFFSISNKLHKSVYITLWKWCTVSENDQYHLYDVIIIIILKVAMWDFFTIPSLRHKLSPTRTLKWPGCNHVQIMCNTLTLIKRLSCATCCVTCHVVQKESSATKFDRVEIPFILSFILLAETMNWWRKLWYDYYFWCMITKSNDLCCAGHRIQTQPGAVQAESGPVHCPTCLWWGCTSEGKNSVSTL